jgi:hypothetical protein
MCSLGTTPSRMHTITLEPVATLTGEDDARIVAFDVDYEGTPVVTVATEPLDYRREGAGGVTFAKTQSASKQGYRIYKAYEGEFFLTTTIGGEPFNIHFTQPLPDGRLLLACGRCVNHNGTAEKNGRIYSEGGEFIHGITLGDGIEHLRVDLSGRIWAGYFDEGVLGNFGWSDPLGHAGLVAWSTDGKQLFEFTPSGDAPPILDCYAMNVAKDRVWICYYSDFPLVQIQNFTIAGQWQSPVSGARAFAVMGTRVLFSGGYDETNHYRLFALKDGSMTFLREFQLADSSNEPLHAVRIVGANDSLYLLRRRELFHLSLRDVP